MEFDPSVIPNAGDAKRVARACAALVGQLRHDPRTAEQYEAWRGRHGLEPGPLRDLAAARAAIFRDKDQDLAILRQFAESDLGLPFGWLPLALLVDFLARALGETTGLHHPVEIEAPVVEGLPKGRAPKGGGAGVERDVWWYYRAKVKRPADTLYAIAKEHNASAGNAGNWHSAVQEAIDRTESWLRKADGGEIAN